ncbi:MAG: YHS domain-containing protein, partial [Oligoflexia bacterium]|nr:YHS domain-containing protein [Oligoflexia bacterium]
MNNQLYKNQIRDPVCNMSVDPIKSAGSFLYQGTTYHFCSEHCL